MSEPCTGLGVSHSGVNNHTVDITVVSGNPGNDITIEATDGGAHLAVAAHETPLQLTTDGTSSGVILSGLNGHLCNINLLGSEADNALSTSINGGLTLATSAWPYTCDIDANSTPHYKNTAGNLVGEPHYYTENGVVFRPINPAAIGTSSEALAGGSGIEDVIFQSPPADAFTYTNNTCRNMTLAWYVRFYSTEWNAQAGSQAFIDYNFDTTGIANSRLNRLHVRGNHLEYVNTTSTDTGLRANIIAPAGAFTFNHTRITVVHNGPTNTNALISNTNETPMFWGFVWYAFPSA